MKPQYWRERKRNKNKGHPNSEKERPSSNNIFKVERVKLSALCRSSSYHLGFKHVL
jgi:hypothetical protein